MNDVMLTTIDNPFNPFSNYEEWDAYDRSMGYNSSSYLARVITSSEELSDEEQIIATSQAIDEILSLDFLGIYMKVSKDDYDNAMMTDAVKV